MKLNEEDFLYEKEDEIETIKIIQTWLIELSYWQGWSQGFLAHEINPYFWQSHYYPEHVFRNNVHLEYGWYISYGNLYVYIDDIIEHSFPDLSMYGMNINHKMVVGKKKLHTYKKENWTQLINTIESTIYRFFRGIRQKNSPRFCSTPAHYYNLPNKYKNFSNNNYISLCQLIGDEWLCECCINQFHVYDDQLGKNLKLKKHQKEFGKLTPKRKLAILKRDSFSCHNCGFSIENDITLELNVKHITSISEGGVTADENLETFCNKCI